MPVRLILFLMRDGVNKNAVWIDHEIDEVWKFWNAGPSDIIAKVFERFGKVADVLEAFFEGVAEFLSECGGDVTVMFSSTNQFNSGFEFKFDRQVHATHPRAIRFVFDHFAFFRGVS